MKWPWRGPAISRHFNTAIIKKTTTVLSAVVVLVSFTGSALADQFTDQEAQLKSSISASQGQLKLLGQQQDTLQNQISLLNQQISVLNNQLWLNEVKMEQLQAQIADAEAKLAANKAILSANIKQMYLDSGVSPLEMIASSQNISDFMNKQQYQDKVKSKIQDAMSAIIILKAQLAAQQASLQNTLLDQRAQQNTLNSTKQHQADLLAQTQGSEAAYQGIVASNNQKLQGIYAERARIDALNHVAISLGGDGNYPWANPATFSTQDDGWGFYLRQCVSYVAWKRRVVQHAPYPTNWGNATDWQSYANGNQVPHAGDIAVFPAYVGGSGSVGHVAYVESVNGNGTINISEYNWQPYRYDTRSGVSANGLYFIR